MRETPPSQQQRPALQLRSVCAGINDNQPRSRQSEGLGRETNDAHVRFCREAYLETPFGSADHDFSRRRPTTSQRAYALCSRVWPRGRDPVEHARFHLFRYVLRVRLKDRPHSSAVLGAVFQTSLSRQLASVPVLLVRLISKPVRDSCNYTNQYG